LELSALQTMVREAKAANIQVIFGLEPTSPAAFGYDYAGVAPTNQVVYAYAQQQGIPVISYQKVPVQGGGSMATGDVPTAAGYQQMTALLENVLPTLGLQMGGGYLQNTVQVGDSVGITNQNTVGTGAFVHFSAVGWFNNNPMLQQQINTNLLGATGTWTSSNPLVLPVDQTGYGQALTAGTAIIRYTSLNNVAFSEWIMYVNDVY
jgi:hypothetical protein